MTEPIADQAVQAAAVSPSGNAATDALLAGMRWPDAGGTVTIAYSFATGQSSWTADYGNDEPGFWAGDFSDAEKGVIRKALASWADVAGISFVEVQDAGTDAGEIRFGRSTLPSTAWAYLPGDAAEPGDVWLGSTRFPQLASQEIVDWAYAPGTWRYFTLVHEIGHALGLVHPHEGGTVGEPLAAELDWVGNSVLSYRTYPGQELGQGYAIEYYPTTPMGLDVAAVQYLYGAAATHAGNDVWQWRQDARLFQTIWDSGGIDTLDWSNQHSAAVIRLAQGSWSELGLPFVWRSDGGSSLPGTLFLARGTVIENARGGYDDDAIGGNAAANRLDGMAGDDLLAGQLGDDLLFGGEGADRIDGGAGDDLVSGDRGDDVLYGSAGADRLFGFAGNDRLYGGTEDDQLQAGDGDDRLYGDLADDLLDGGTGQDALFGGEGDDRLDGGFGDDRLWGGGGNDLLAGGPGDDLLDPGSGDDLVDAGDGDDRIIAWYGTDSVDGGAGTDTLLVAFASTGFRLDGDHTHARLTDLDPTDTLIGPTDLQSIERLTFLDRTIAWQDGSWQTVG